MNWTYQHDGASAHKAKSVNKWLEENVPAHNTSGPTGEWPANSCDITWIENVWGIMEAPLDENPPQTIRQLKLRLKKVWDEFDPGLLTKMAKGMKQRLKDVIAKKGGCIGK